MLYAVEYVAFIGEKAMLRNVGHLCRYFVLRMFNYLFIHLFILFLFWGVEGVVYMTLEIRGSKNAQKEGLFRKARLVVLQCPSPPPPPPRVVSKVFERGWEG